MMEQDSTDPTGVSADQPGPSVERARQRKANAALELKLANATWGEIAETLGYPTPRAAKVAVERALEANLQSEDRELLRGLASARLERLVRAVWHKAINPENPEQMVAITKVREVISDHRKLLGLDAPTEVIIHQPTRTELEEWVAKVVNRATPPVIEGDIIDVTWDDEEQQGPPELEVG